LTDRNGDSCYVGTTNGSAMKTSTIAINIGPKGKKILNLAIGEFLGQGSQLQEIKSTIMSINIIGERKGSSSNGCYEQAIETPCSKLEVIMIETETLRCHSNGRPAETLRKTTGKSLVKCISIKVLSS
jgi:hypothetical protein